MVRWQARRPEIELETCLAGIQSDEISRRKTGQDSKHDAMRVFSVDAIMLFLRRRDREIVPLRTVQSDEHLRVFESLVIPGSGPVVGRHVELATALDARQDPVVRSPTLVRDGHDER